MPNEMHSWKIGLRNFDCVLVIEIARKIKSADGSHRQLLHGATTSAMKSALLMLAHKVGHEVVRIRTLLSESDNSSRECQENRLARCLQNQRSQAQPAVNLIGSSEQHPTSRHEREAMILKELMRENLEVYTLTESGRISSAADMMRDKRVGSIVIVDDSKCRTIVPIVYQSGLASPMKQLGQLFYNQ